MKRMTYSEITATVAVGLPFAITADQKPLTATQIEVLTSSLGALHGGALSGPLADRVRESVRELFVQYLTGGGHRRLPSEVAYFVAQYDPASGCHCVLAIVTANGMLEHVTDADPHPATPELLTAITTGLPGAAELIAQQILHDDELHEAHVRNDEGWTFQLFVRSMRSAIQTARPVATFDSREEAYSAMREADRIHEGRQAWIERYETAGPLYGIALGHGTYECLGDDLVTGATRNALEAQRTAARIRLAQPGAEVALAIKQPGDTCYRVDGTPVAQWIRLLTAPEHE